MSSLVTPVESVFEISSGKGDKPTDRQTDTQTPLNTPPT